LAFRKSSSNKLSQENLACWVKAWEELVKLTDKEFDRESIPSIIAELKSLTKNQKNINEDAIRLLLNSVWINFLILNHFKEVPVNGISRMYKGKPLIQLSTRQRWLDIFWFTLFHELGHIYNWDLKKEGIIIDGDEKIENDLEKQADIFAQNNLISPDAYQLNIISKKIVGIKDLEYLSNVEWVWVNIIAGRVSHDLTGKQDNIWQLVSWLRPTIKK
jgi:HTH-type transcriptional regulator/antitoxin HigA